MAEVSIVVPAYNEEQAVGALVRRVREVFARTSHVCEVIVVDDASHDATARIAEEAGAIVIRHPLNLGYGNALLTGIRQARAPLVAITDADGTYPVEQLPGMIDELLARRLDMLVGRRRGQQYKGGMVKRLGRVCFKFLAEFTCGRSIPDINSGLRVMRRAMVLRFADVLCGGFSFTTTLTVIAFLTNHFVAYRNVDYHKRVGTSHVRHLRDTLRALQILVMTILIFNPIKLYLLFALHVAALGGLALVTCLLFPSLAGAVLTGGLFFLTACLLMGFGFRAEQHRVSPRGIDTFSPAGDADVRAYAVSSMRVRLPSMSAADAEQTPAAMS